MIIWYGGRANLAPDTNPFNPELFRGYDAAGNRLYTVSASDITPVSYDTDAERIAITNKYPERHFVNGYLETGEQRIVCSYHSTDLHYYPPEINIRPQHFAVDKDGRIYCAMAPLKVSIAYIQVYVGLNGVTESDIRSLIARGGLSTDEKYDYIQYNQPGTLFDRIYDVYLDFFRVYRQGGDRVTDFPAVHDRPIRAVEVDNNGYFYIAGEPNASDIYLKKFNVAGTLQWEVELDRWWMDAPDFYTHVVFNSQFGSFERDDYQILRHDIQILIDAAYNVYVLISPVLAGVSIGGYGGITFGKKGGSFRKYNSSGVLQWERKFFVDQTKYNSVILSDGMGGMTADGTYIYISTTVAINDYTIDDTAYFFNEGETTVNLSKWDSDGLSIASHTIPRYQEAPGYGQILRLEYNADNGFLYCCPSIVGGYYYGYPAVYILDPATFAEQTLFPSNLIFYGSSAKGYSSTSYTAYPYIPFFSFDSNGTIYLAASHGGAWLNDYWRVFDSGQNELWAGQVEEAYGMSLCQSPYIVEDTQLPALYFPLKTRICDWIGDKYVSIPALAFILSIEAPTYLRDYVGPPRPIVIRLYLYGSPAIELSALNITIRRTAGGRSLSANILIPDLAALDAIEARYGNDLILMRGVVLEDGTEQLDEMIRAPSNSLRPDRTANRFRVTIGGYVEEGTLENRTRTLRHIRQIDLEEGKRRVACDVDTYLQPGDTANIGGGDSMIAGEIEIAIAPASSTMAVNESM